MLDYSYIGLYKSVLSCKYHDSVILGVISMVYHFRHDHIASVRVPPCDSGPAQCCQHAQSHADSAETARALHQVSHVGKPNGRLALPHLSF